MLQLPQDKKSDHIAAYVISHGLTVRLLFIVLWINTSLSTQSTYDRERIYV